MKHRDSGLKSCTVAIYLSAKLQVVANSSQLYSYRYLLEVQMPYFSAFYALCRDVCWMLVVISWCLSSIQLGIFPYLPHSCYLWLEMALFRKKQRKYRKIQKNIHNSATKHMIFCKNKKVLKAQDLVLLFLKRIVFYFGHDPWRPHFCTSQARKQ